LLRLRFDYWNDTWVMGSSIKHDHRLFLIVYYIRWFCAALLHFTFQVAISCDPLCRYMFYSFYKKLSTKYYCCVLVAYVVKHIVLKSTRWKVADEWHLHRFSLSITVSDTTLCDIFEQVVGSGVIKQFIYRACLKMWP